MSGNLRLEAGIPCLASERREGSKWPSAEFYSPEAYLGVQPLAFKLINMMSKNGPCVYYMEVKCMFLSQLCATYEWAETLNTTFGRRQQASADTKKAEYVLFIL